MTSGLPPAWQLHTRTAGKEITEQATIANLEAVCLQTVPWAPGEGAHGELLL